ncbi:MAG: SET domain-containing protein-lysine N-methyltransferase [Candidatus Diapherotrites archaeon]|uniref:SET domain-containing protein-lysine N-methyltransferase n=1 Tax=Candidatus Iainarchaeum sp. TaxID=3101447 RepID=A0A8T4LFW0_9ARCH|nr:SET domain-containing protein-lysine N-methyltransferase [Candidatus Diapherotrites archaeon]
MDPRDLISVNVNVFEGDILLCDSYVSDVAPEFVKKLSTHKKTYSFTPELTHSDILGFKLCTIFRLGRISRLTVFIKSGSPHSLQIPLIVQEAADDTGFDRSKIEYFVWEKGEMIPVSNEAIRKARHLHEIERLLAFERLQKTVEILRKECRNDQQETFETILEHFVEETNELKEGIKNKDTANTQEELGDILFNVFLFAKIAQEENQFDMEKLLDTVNEKMVKRHDQIFPNRNVVILVSPIHGKGVFALQDIKAGTIADKWQAYAQNQNPRTDKTVDQFVNHSCKPNAYAKDSVDIALRDIKAGEEITCDYTKENGIHPKFKCNCQCKNCRGAIYTNFQRIGPEKD